MHIFIWLICYVDQINSYKIGHFSYFYNFINQAKDKCFGEGLYPAVNFIISRKRRGFLSEGLINIFMLNN